MTDKNKTESDKTLLDLGDDLSRIRHRMRLLELALIRNPDDAADERYQDGVRQQVQDIMGHIEQLEKDLDTVISNAR